MGFFVFLIWFLWFLFIMYPPEFHTQSCCVLIRLCQGYVKNHHFFNVLLIVLTKNWFSYTAFYSTQLSRLNESCHPQWYILTTAKHTCACSMVIITVRSGMFLYMYHFRRRVLVPDKD